jgi:hypothetical protein
MEFRVRFFDEDGKWQYARRKNQLPPRREGCSVSNGKIYRFLKRQFAIRWCRNHRHFAKTFIILGEDGSSEVYNVDSC